MKSVRCLLIVLLVSQAAVGLAQDAAELELDHRVQSDFVTPHTAWAKPYALGKTRALFFLRGRGTEPREVIELSQRFDFDFQMAFWTRIIDSTKEHWHGGDLGVQRIDRLLSEKWDVFVFLGVSVEQLSTDQQSRLLEAVVNGAGLVLVESDDKRIYKDKNRLPMEPALGLSGTAYRIGRGRGLLAGSPPALEYRPGWETAYDLWAAQLGRNILWAAGKEPKVQLALDPATPEIRRDSLPGRVATLRWQFPQEVARLTVSLTLRRQDGETLALPEVSVTDASGVASVALPPVRADDYSLDAIARSDRGVESFRSLPLRVMADRAVSDVALTQDWAEIGGRFVGHVTLTGEPATTDRVVVSLLGPEGREWAKQTATESNGVAAFAFPVESWFPMLVTVRATIWREGQEIASASRPAHVVQRGRDRFNFVMWDYPFGPLGPYGTEALARSGVTVFLSQVPKPPDYLAAHGMSYLPYTTRIETAYDPKGAMEPACWNDEAKISAHIDRIVAKYAPSRAYGVFAYSLGDEGAVRGSCQSPHCLAAYRKYLQGQYGTVEALNASWGSSYAGFDDVQLTQADDLNEAAALAAGNFPRWFDRQAYQSFNFCNLCTRFGAAFRKMDPESLCGFEGSGTLKNADDLDGFVRANTFWAPYPGPADEVLRSIAPRDFPRANWMGYTKDADSLLEKYWRMITRGSDSVWWWRWDAIGRFHGWLSPTLDLYPATKEIVDDTRVVRDGLGRWLHLSDMQDDGIGILYSLPSAYAARIQSSPTFGGYEAEHTAWHNTLRELGLNFRYITDAMLRRGDADLGRFKLLILPLDQALGDAEAQALREWVIAGGTLVADVRPAIYDAHCKPRTAGALDDLFGISRNAFADAAVRDAALTGTVADVAFGVTAPRLRVDPGVASADAAPMGAAGDAPVFLVHSVGKGRTVLLNFALSSYPGLSMAATPESATDPFCAIFRSAGVEPSIRLTNAEGQRMRNVEITRWRNGGIEMVSIFRHGGVAEPAHVSLSGARYVVDIKARRPLGRMESFDVELTPFRAQFFALSPKRFDGAKVSLSQKTVSPGETVRASVRFPRAVGLQAARLDLRGPDGRTRDSFRQVQVTDRKTVEVAVPVAWNDPAGTWTLDITDLFSGKTTSQSFRVK